MSIRSLLGRAKRLAGRMGIPGGFGFWRPVRIDGDDGPAIDLVDADGNPDPDNIPDFDDRWESPDGTPLAGVDPLDESTWPERADASHQP